MVAAPAQSVRDEKYARAVDREVAPLWHDRFARAIWRHLPQLGPNALVLDVHAGPGHTTEEVLRRTPPGTRVVALEPQETLRTLAKARLAEFADQVYVKPGELADVTEMADGTYDAVIANLVLSDAQDFSAALQELLRVTKAGGSVMLTMPMDGSWVEVEDLFREVLRGAEQKDAARRLRHLGRLRPTGHEMAKTVTDLGIGPHHFVLEQERFHLLFRSGREFLFAPIIELGPLRVWKAILGRHDAPQELFWQLKESIDTYFLQDVFAVSIVAGILHVVKPAPGSAGAQTAADTTGAYWAQFPTLDALFQQAESADLGEDEIEMDMEIDVDVDVDSHPIQVGSSPDASTPSGSSMRMSAEDEAIFALLDQPAKGTAPDTELDALLDQVLEFAGSEPDEAPERSSALDDLIPEELLEVGPAPDLKTKPGDTLSRIRSLLPPPPSESTSGASKPSRGPSAAPERKTPSAKPAPPRRPPPPPPTGKLRRPPKKS